MDVKSIASKLKPENSSWSLEPQQSDVQFSPYLIMDRSEWARLRADTPMTLLPHELEQMSGIIEELSVRRSRGDLSPPIAVAEFLCRGHAGVTRSDIAILGTQGKQAPVHPRCCRLGCRRQEHDSTCAQSAPRTLARPSARRPGNDRWVPVPERGTLKDAAS